MSCSLDLRINISHLSDEDWLRIVYHIMGEISDPFQPRNAVDREFQNLLEYIWSRSVKELFEAIKSGLGKLKRHSPQNYQNFVSYFARFPLW